ncbi:hypothetical protein GGQ74_000620 [Desulfobaculum xiamenense]|uniref:FlgN protein n=1 Tax=Desulfobaculum xiamenense TaxID=995050 RepID=A0A846QIS5_9BACT|nr:flagellar protein FlgN [Desulfobaculum xiamenense]NJB66980.1 hypothetical protein [Desulfobaculum xiamenense]
MQSRIRDNMHRQAGALKVLFGLLEEEFACLTGRDPQAVTGIELSVQELLRQVAMERVALRKLVVATVPGAQNMADFVATLPQEDRGEFERLLREADEREQACAVQAEKNAQLAYALVEQSRGMLDFMHRQIQPKDTTTYGRSGRYAQHHPQAALLRGRL